MVGCLGIVGRCVVTSHVVTFQSVVGVYLVCYNYKLMFMCKRSELDLYLFLLDIYSSYVTLHLLV